MKLIINRKIFYILIGLLIVVNLFYCVSFSYDSTHYIYLSKIIQINKWEDWNPIRGLLFPLIQFICTKIFGETNNGLLIQFIIAQILLFLFSSALVAEVFNIRGRKRIDLILILVLLIIVLDPIVFGYFHIVLTEYLAATFAVISTYFSFCLLKRIALKSTTKKFVIFIIAFYSSMVPISWHIKQPYFGAIYFPFLICCILLLFINMKKNIKIVVQLNIIIFASLSLSILLWNSFLIYNDTEIDSLNKLASTIKHVLEFQTKKQSIFSFKRIFENYLAAANFYELDLYMNNDYSIIKIPSLIRSNENGHYAFRMYSVNPEYTNMADGRTPFQDFVAQYETFYSPPKWFNKIQIIRTGISNVLFSIVFILMPFVFIISLLRFLFMKKQGEIVLLSGTALLNSILHCFILPIDRYNFYGYILGLIIIIILLFKIINKIINQHIFMKLM